MMNTKRLIQTLLTISTCLFMFGCVTVNQHPAGLPEFSAKQFDASMYQSKVDNFVILLDASSSMNDYYMDNPKFIIGKAIAGRMNVTIPELGQIAGLRSFGHDESVSKNETELFYGMVEYNTAALAEQLDVISKAGGYTPITSAIEAMGKDLESHPGKTAVIIISDGLDPAITPDIATALATATAVKQQYGDNICFYPIQVGNAEEGTAFLSELASIGGCASLINADELLDGDAMAAFVEEVFLEKASPKAMDSDGDGVLDPDDQCPGTPVGAKVNAVGCWVLDNVLFDFDKDIIKPEAFAQLDEVYEILEKNPAMSVELQGHTCNIGSRKYNMGLSQRRANSVANYLVNKGIARNRLATTGFGFDRPVALNSTEYGRSLNRRVEIHPY